MCVSYCESYTPSRSVSSSFFFSSRRRHTRLQGDWSSAVCSSDLSQHQLRNAPVRRNAHRPQVARLKFPFRLRVCSAVARHIRVLARRRAVPRLRALSLRFCQIENFRALGVEPKNIRRSLDTGDKLRSRGADLLAKNMKRAFTIRYIQNGFAVRRPFIRTALAFVHCEALQLANFACPGIHVRHKDGRRDVRDRKSTRLNSSHLVISYA